ncbi:MAG: hypothetical protein ACM30G_10570 [Micromonosporaceae bacterium]
MVPGKPAGEPQTTPRFAGATAPTGRDNVEMFAWLDADGFVHGRKVSGPVAGTSPGGA